MLVRAARCYRWGIWFQLVNLERAYVLAGRRSNESSQALRSVPGAIFDQSKKVTEHLRQRNLPSNLRREILDEPSRPDRETQQRLSTRTVRLTEHFQADEMNHEQFDHTTTLTESILAQLVVTVEAAPGHELVEGDELPQRVEGYHKGQGQHDDSARPEQG